MLDNVLKIISTRFQKAKSTTEECKDELMVASGQFTLERDGEDHRTHTVSDADADWGKTNLFRAFYLKSLLCIM